MAHRIDGAMTTVQTSRSQPSSHSGRRHAALEELSVGDHPVLAIRDLGHGDVR